MTQSLVIVLTATWRLAGSRRKDTFVYMGFAYKSRSNPHVDRSPFNVRFRNYIRYFELLALLAVRAQIATAECKLRPKKRPYKFVCTFPLL